MANGDVVGSARIRIELDSDGVLAEATQIGNQIFSALTNAVQGAASAITSTLGSAASAVGDTLTNALRGAASAITSALASAASAVGDTLVAGFQAATLAATALGTATITAGVAFNSLSQQVTGALTAVLGTRDAANQLIGEVIELNQTAAFSRQAFLDATRQLVGFGVEADLVTDSLDAIQQATVAIGGGEEEFARITEALARVESEGGLTAGTLGILQRLGLNVIQVIADATGAPVEAIQAEMDAGMIGLEQITDALNTRFSGAVDNYANTWQGAQGMVLAAVRNIGSALVEPFIGLEEGGAAVDGLNAIADGLFHIQSNVIPGLLPQVEGLAETFVRVAEAVGSMLGNIPDDAFAGIASSLEGLGPIVAAVGAGLATAFAGSLPIIGQFLRGFNPIVVAVGALIAATPELREVFLDVFSQVADAVQPVVEAIGPLAQELMPALTQVVVALVDAALPLVAVLGALIPPMLELATVILPPLAEVIEFLAPAVVALTTALLAYNATATLVRTITAAWAAIQVVLNAVLLANPIGLVVVALAALAAGLIFAYQNSETFREIVQGAFAAVQAAATAVVTFFTEVFVPFFTNLAASWAAAWAGIRNAVSSAINAVVGFIAGGLTTARDTVNARLAAIVGFFASLPGRILGALSSFPGLLVSRGRALIDGLRSGVVSAAGAVLSFFRSLPSTILGAIPNPGGILVSAGRAIIDGLVAGIRGAAGAVRDAIGGIASTIRGFLPFSPAKEGPLRDHPVDLAGRKIVQGLQEGLQAEEQNLVRTLRHITGTISGGLNASGTAPALNIQSAILNDPAVRLMLEPSRQATGAASDGDSIAAALAGLSRGSAGPATVLAGVRRAPADERPVTINLNGLQDLDANADRIINRLKWVM